MYVAVEELTVSHQCHCVCLNVVDTVGHHCVSYTYMYMYTCTLSAGHSGGAPSAVSD